MPTLRVPCGPWRRSMKVAELDRLGRTRLRTCGGHAVAEAVVAQRALLRDADIASPLWTLAPFDEGRRIGSTGSDTPAHMRGSCRRRGGRSTACTSARCRHCESPVDPGAVR